MGTTAILVVAAMLTNALPPNPLPAQFTGRYGVQFNNPVSASLNGMMWDRLNAQMVWRAELLRKGYSPEQVNALKEKDLKEAFLRGSIEGVSPKTSTKGSSTAASRFRPSGKRVMLDLVVRELSPDPETRKALADMMRRGFTAFEAEAKRTGMDNDLAAAIAFFVGAAFTVEDGKPPSEASMGVLAKALQESLDTPEVRKIPDLDKQRFYEFMVIMGTFLLVSMGEDVEESAAKELQEVSRQILKKFLNMDPEKLRLTDQGLVPR